MLKQIGRMDDGGLGGQPPSGGCVLKLSGYMLLISAFTSRLRAAVC